MNMIKSLAVFTLAASVSINVFAHQVAIDKQTQLVPIPAYNPPVGGPSVTASVDTLNAFLETINPVFHKIYPLLMFDFNDKARKDWSNLPSRFAHRQGMSLAEMTDKQRALLFQFLSASLGKDGYKMVSDTLGADAFLLEHEGPKSRWLRIAPKYHAFAIYGVPSKTGQWGWQFGGHHLAINMSYNQGKVTSISPSFIGAEPALFKVNGKTFHTNKDMHDAGYAVFKSLSQKQQQTAALPTAPEEALVVGASSDGKVPPQFGIKGSELNAKQQKLLLNAIRQWVEIQPNEPADERMADIANNIDKLTYAWYGSGEVNTHAYMRIQGPTVIIEMLSMKSAIEDGRGHYHTIYRNPMMEYGVKYRKRL